MLREAASQLEAGEQADPGAAPAPEDRGPRYTIIQNGQHGLIGPSELSTINPSDFDIYLDLCRGILYVKLPGKKGVRRRTDDTGLQAEDVNLLAAFIRHPCHLISSDNYWEFHSEGDYLTRNAFAKRIGRIRRAVQNGSAAGPFIRRSATASYEVSRTGNAFYFAGAGISYCLISPAGHPRKI